MEMAVNRVLIGLVSILLIAWAAVFTVPTDKLIILLNGILAGCGAAIAVAYGPLLLNSFMGRHPYDRVRQMTLGFFLCWAAIFTTLSASVYVRMTDLPVPALTIVCLARVLAIAAAVLQVTAPDFGLGIFHGRDRKVLTGSVVVGFIVALAAIYAQDTAILAGL